MGREGARKRNRKSSGGGKKTTRNGLSEGPGGSEQRLRSQGTDYVSVCSAPACALNTFSIATSFHMLPQVKGVWFQ